MDQNTNVLRCCRLVVILSFVLILSGCASSAKKYEKSGFAFDTIISITVYHSDRETAEHALADAFELCDHYDRLFAISDPDSDIYKLNHADGQEVTVDDDTYRLLERSIEYAVLSDGLFDVTVQPLYELWDFQGEHEDLPSEEAIRKAMESVGYQNILLLDDNRVQLLNGAQINPGAIAKGYIADRLKERLLFGGITSGLINLGGNVLAIGSKDDHTPFTIGLAKPFDETGSMISEVTAVDTSVVTSGIYQRYFIHEDKIYHHILDPRTGYPADTDLNAAVVITKSSTDADALSTICMLLGSKKAKELIDTIPDTDLILIDRDNHIL